MEFSLSVYDCLFQFFRLLYNPRRIFLTHTVQNNHHLFRIGFIQRLNSTGIFGIRIFDEVKMISAPLPFKVLPVLTSFSFTVQPISPARSSSTLTRLAPAQTITVPYVLSNHGLHFQVVTFAYHSTHYLKY